MKAGLVKHLLCYSQFETDTVLSGKYALDTWLCARISIGPYFTTV